ncbi:gluconate:H+ symporter, GntP family [Prosthecobacter debontii]|uniref:Gluconate:H+ symporter, GntP family n=1 Tax=Prosthecobacter debontii TaxID=48467 RepID=A0A1T4YWY4_9BACT|nr:GntP family permease [Prosthecobacter debontii]SKB05765.1 gluconate:H+ symporter, GntP family [Prosthecobacter debontii]
MISLSLVALGLIIVVLALLGLRLHAFLAMMLAAFVVAVVTPQDALVSYASQQQVLGKMTAVEATKFAATTPPERVMKAFGETCASMGLLICMASIMGKSLLDSGAAMRIVQSLLGLFGRARAHIAFVLTGFSLAIPVYFDAVFYLLMPIGKAMTKATGGNYLLYILTIIAGATMAHSLVPPTPGPLFAAKELGVDVGTMMVGGLIVGLFTASFGLAYAVWANRRWKIELPVEDAQAVDAAASGPLPSLALSILPIVVPIVLITWGSLQAKTPWYADSNLALSAGAIISLCLLAWQKRHGDVATQGGLQEVVQGAIMSGATVLLITAAGGAFGSTLRQTGVAEVIQNLGAGASKFWALPICFLITTLVRTAQGSATVAMITAAPLARAFMESGGLPFHPVYLALAVGCGSKPVPWLNDSGFWIITRMSGMTETQTLKIVTPMMSLMGVVGLPVVMIGAWLLPMR